MKGDVMTEEKVKQLIREARVAGEIAAECAAISERKTHEAHADAMRVLPGGAEVVARNPIDSDADYGRRYAAAESPQEPRHCEIHHCPETAEGCLVCFSQTLFPAVSKTGAACLRDDWWEFRDWLEDETSDWDELAMAQLMEMMKKDPGNLLLRWRLETGPPAEAQALRELYGAIKEMLNIEVEPVRPLSHPRDYVAEALAIIDGRSNLTATKDHLKALHALWLQATQAVRDLAKGK
jgi:hypothetical protein